MSQIMLQRPRFEPKRSLGIVVEFTCAICKRSIDDGVTITASHNGIKFMSCDSHTPNPTRRV